MPMWRRLLVQIWCGFWTRIMTYPSMSLVTTVAVQRLFRLLFVHVQRKTLASKYLSCSSVFNFRRPNVCPSYSSRGNPLFVSVIFAKMENSPVKYKQILINGCANKIECKWTLILFFDLESKIKCECVNISLSLFRLCDFVRSWNSRWISIIFLKVSLA